ncbi:GRN [Mytilus edulis]|uniref:GRN n=1 Tax=Mytilus edulis TaxID=6550 RepID=A0A8S3UXH9_MYTED|nr:GRN [Mytilus edulis]
MGLVKLTTLISFWIFIVNGSCPFEYYQCSDFLDWCCPSGYTCTGNNSCDNYNSIDPTAGLGGFLQCWLLLLHFYGTSSCYQEDEESDLWNNTLYWMKSRNIVMKVGSLEQHIALYAESEQWNNTLIGSMEQNIVLDQESELWNNTLYWMKRWSYGQTHRIGGRVRDIEKHLVLDEEMGLWNNTLYKIKSRIYGTTHCIR